MRTAMEITADQIANPVSRLRIVRRQCVESLARHREKMASADRKEMAELLKEEGLLIGQQTKYQNAKTDVFWADAVEARG